MERTRMLLSDRTVVGYLLLFVSTLCFSVNNNLAKESYQHGVSVDVMLVGRSWSLMLLIGCWFLVRGAWPVVPYGCRLWALFAAVMFATNAWSLLSAFDLMPVSLAILVFYLFPFLVSLLAAALGIERLRPLMLAGLLVAFGGLVLALDVEGELNGLGIALSFVAALAISGNILATGRILRAGASPVAVAFWMMVGGSIAFSINLLVGSPPSLPDNLTGWAAYGGTVAFVGIAFVTFYMALAFLSEPKAALVMNLEPVMTIVIAVFLFAEPFGAYQWLGAALVFAAIIGVTVAGRRR